MLTDDVDFSSLMDVVEAFLACTEASDGPIAGFPASVGSSTNDSLGLSGSGTFTASTAALSRFNGMSSSTCSLSSIIVRDRMWCGMIED